MESQQPKESGPEAPNQRMIEFLRSVPPFDTLGTGELTRLVSQMEMGYFPAGQRIQSKGDQPFRHLYIIQKGSARISLVDDEGEDLLVDVRGEGDYFGATSILQDKAPMFDISAHQDLICLMLPAEEVRQLVSDYPVFERYFNFSLARTIKAVRQAEDFGRPQPIGQCAIRGGHHVWLLQATSSSRAPPAQVPGPGLTNRSRRVLWPGPRPRRLSRPPGECPVAPRAGAPADWRSAWGVRG